MLWLNSCQRHIGRKMLILFRDSKLFWVLCRSSQLITSQEKKLHLAIIRCTSFSRFSTHPNVMLTELSRKIEGQKENFQLWLLKYEQGVCEALKLPSDDHTVMTHKKRVVHNFQKDELMNMSVKNPDFANVLKILDCHVDSLPVSQFPVILKCLTNLFIPEDNSTMVKLYEKCLDNMHIFEVQELALFTQCAFVSGKIDVCTKILQNMHNMLEGPKIPLTSSTSDWCVLFRCLSPLMSHRMLGLCVTFIVRYIKEKSVIDFSSLRLFCELAEGSSEEAKDIIQERILQSEFLSMDVNFNFEQLDIESCSVLGRHLDSLFGHTLLQSKIRHVWHAAFLNEGSVLSPTQALNLAFFLPPRHLSVPSMYTELKPTKDIYRQEFSYPLVKCIKDSDNHRLFWFLRLFHQTKLPWKALSALHDHLVSVFDERSLEEQQWLFEQDEDILVLLHFFLQKLAHIGFDISDQLTLAISRQCSTDNQVLPVSKAKASLLVCGLISKLFKDKPLLPKETELFSAILNQLSMSSLMHISANLEMGFRKDAQSLSAVVKGKMRSFALQSRNLLHDRLSSTHRLPANFLSKNFDNTWSTSKGVFERSGILHTVVSYLKDLTQEPNEVNCIRAIEILSVAPCNLPVYKPSLFENILQFIYTCHPTPIRASLLLLHILSSAAYRPKDFDRFASFCLLLQEDVRVTSLLSPAQQVLLAYCLSLYKIYEENTLCSVFSVDFLLAFENELDDALYLHGRSADFYHNCLHSLNQGVAVECPHLAIDYFTSPSERAGGRASQEFINSVQRIFHDSSYVQLGTQSAYGHRIDALVCLDENCDPVDPNTSEGNVSFKLAFLYLSSRDICFKAKGRQTGSVKALVRQLKLLGYFVVEIPYYRLYGMDMNSQEAVDDFFREQIIHAIGPQFFLT